jgi:tetratricopeptide (TPR) repeat protein
MSTSQKKFNFLLDIKLLQIFNDYAKRAGLSKAQIIRNWLDTLEPVIRLTELQPQGKLTSYSFIVDATTADKINETARRYGLPVGTFLRLLLNSKLLVTNPIKAEQSVAAQLLQTGRLKDVIALLESKVSALSVDKLEYLANAYIGLGKFHLAEAVIQEIETRSTNSNNQQHVLARLFSLKAEMSRFRLDTHQSKIYLNSALQLAIKASDMRCLGRVYYQLAMLEFMHDNTASAVDLFTKSLDSLTVRSDPIQIAINYLYLGRLSELEGNNLFTDKYFKRAEEILVQVDNTYYLGWVYNALGMSAAIKGDVQQAQIYINKSLDASNKSGSDMEMHYSYKYLGIINLAEGKSDLAHNYLMLADQKEQIFRPGVKNSRNQLMKLIIQAKDNFDSSINQMTAVAAASQNQVKPTLSKYLINSARIMHGNRREIQKGVANLTALQNKTSGQLKHVITKTLQTKMIQVVR